MLALLTLALPLHALPFENESLNYQAYYQGPFSADKKIGIADIQWQTRMLVMGEAADAVLETSMKVSSQNYEFVEGLYPFRLHYRSLLELTRQQSLAYERIDSTKEHQRELSWMDHDNDRVLRYRPDPKQRTAKPTPVGLADWITASSQYDFYKPARHKLEEGMLDEMALLQQIRQQPLAKGKRWEHSVTDGKKQYLYKVSVVGQTILNLDHHKYPAWKIKLEGYRNKRGKYQSAHLPVYVWLGKDEAQTPLRFEHRDDIGRFVIDLVSSRDQT